MQQLSIGVEAIAATAGRYGVDFLAAAEKNEK